MIEIAGMHKHYMMGNTIVKALNGIDLSIGLNEYVAIAGPSGSGKSTLMNMIGCLDAPTSGSYYLDGIQVSELDDNRLAEIRNTRIGFVFQGFNLVKKLSALENVELPQIYSGERTAMRHEKSVKALHRVGLSDRLSHTPAELSGGQQQRVAIARALVTSPPIILADEPTGNLDSKSGSEIMRLFSELHEKGNTVIVITHDERIARAAKRTVRIMDGMITEDREAG